MENDIDKYFNEEENFWTNQQILGMREVLRGIIVKDWASMQLESMDFSQCNKVLIKNTVDFYFEYWRNRCMVLHAPESIKQHLRKETQAIKLEVISGSNKNFNRCVNSCPVNEE